jgi:hypothetical protein
MAAIIDPTKEMAVSSTRDADRRVEWFRAHLKSEGVVPAPGSAFEKSLRALTSLAAAARGERPPPANVGFAEEIRDALGADYVIKALHRGLPGATASLAGSYGVFSGPEIGLMRAVSRTSERDLAWEVLVSALAASFASNVKREEPDVACTYNGARWGIACKVLYSNDSDHHIDRIVEGAKQIERAACDFGVVIVNVTNLVRHDLFVPDVTPDTVLSIRDPKLAISALEGELRRITAGINREKTFRRVTEDKQGNARMKTREILVFAQTVAAVRRVLTVMSMVHALEFRAVSVGSDVFIDRLNHAIQTTVTHVVN